MVEIRNRQDIEFVDDTCGQIQELHNSDNMSIAYAIITGKAKRHMHKVMEEVYFIEKGYGRLHLGEETLQVRKDDIIPIPKNVYHYLENPYPEPLEVLVVTHPRYDPSDVIEE